MHFDSHSVSQKDGNGYCLWSYDNNFRYYDSGGTLHSFPNAYLASDGQTTYPLPRGTCHSGTLQTSQIAPDGSGLTLAATASGGINAGVNVTAETVRNRHGDLFNGIAHAGTPVFEDTNGNYVSYSNPVSGEIDWTDTTGTTVVKDVVESSGCTNPINGQAYPACEEIEVAEPGSTAYATYLLVKANFAVNTGAGCAGISDYSGTVTLPVFLVLPQNSNSTHWYYQFGYDSAGRLNSATFPSGGVTTFAYGSLCTYGDGSPASVTVQENDGEGHSGTTSYVRGATASGNPTMTISRPDGSSTLVTLAADGSGLPIDEKTYDTDGTTLLREVSYTLASSGGAEFPATAVTSLNGVKVAERDTTFDAYGNLTQETDIDWAGDPTGGTKRITTITYCSSCPGYDRPSEVKITDGSGNIFSDTQIAYDNYSSPFTMQSANSLQNHDSAYGTNNANRGNPTSITHRVNASQNLTTYLGYDDAGNVVTAQDANGNILSAVFGNCANAFPSSMTVPGGTENLSVECQRGLLTASTDPNQATKSFGYDGEGRLTSTSNPDGGGATIAYNSPTETEITTKIDGSQNLVRYALADGYGRPIFSQTASPSGGCDTVETVYDAMGRPAQVSTPYNTACGSPSAASAFSGSTFDGLGRVLKTTAPDGSATTDTYSANATEATDPAGIRRILEDDGWGDLWQVCEVSGQPGSGNCNLAVAGSGFLTQYGYSPLGKLTSVNEGGQTRSFSFDWLGRMTSETNPESGTTNYTFDSDPTCGSSAGDLVKRVDAMGNVTCYQRDAWHRVTQITYPSGPYSSVTSPKTFVYDGATVDGAAMANAKGRLAEAFTGPASGKTTDEGFGYL
ncbi:MAG TPA: hypothetical protein VE996_00565 [Terriglobales bacterium]|nr:hypothetical protein [Terriglobales bacterium]